MQSQELPPNPGKVLSALLKDLRLAPVGLAAAMGISRARMHYLLKGKTPITPNTAIRLEIATGLTAEYWLQLQAARDLFEERLQNAAEFEQLCRVNPTVRLSHLPERQRV
ncbi:HigA family addiction module antitoxin [Sphingomonas flavescens]|uniref:HigA family addiction module antitoxin n=1 Tax=Sphingomonas flavescens TaxID=3132797 RepID=UPI002803C8EE|nr:HigA family addiction module antitoxin [Sphingomonas limnosediminicola]